MFCIKCGSKNFGEAIYCQKCGAALESEEETRIATTSTSNMPEDDEQQIFSINPTLMFVKIGYGIAVIGAFLFVILLTLLGNSFGIAISPLISIPCALLILLIPAVYHAKHKLLRYTLTDSKVEIEQGLISKTTRNVPLRIIQDVTVSATIVQRMLGFGNLEIENANEQDKKIILKNINSPKKYAEMLLKQMRRLNK